jgi:O-antigen ligase
VKSLLSNNTIPAVAILVFVAVLSVSILQMSLLPFAVIIAIIIAAAIVLFAFQKPWIMTFFIAAGSYLGSSFYFAEGSPLPVSLFQFFLFAALGLYLLHVLYFSTVHIRYTGYELPVLLFVALIFLSLIYSPDRESGLINALRFVVLLIFSGYVINTVRSVKVVSGILMTLVFLSILFSGFAALETIFNPQIAIQNLTAAGMKVERASVGSLYNDPNRFAAILFLPAAFTFSVVNSDLGYKYKAISAVCFLIILAGLFSTFSRSGFLSFVIITLIIVTLFKNWKNATIVGFLLLLIVLAVPQLRNVLFLNIERVLSVLTGAGDDSSGIRVMLGMAGVQMFIDSFFLGVGFDGFSEYFTNYYTLQESIGVYEPHNITYTIMAELGLIGLFFYLFYLYVIFFHAWRNVKLASAQLEKVVATALLSAFTAYTLFYQFYGGGLLDSNLMLIQALIFVVYFRLSDETQKTGNNAALT